MPSRTLLLAALLLGVASEAHGQNDSGFQSAFAAAVKADNFAEQQALVQNAKGDTVNNAFMSMEVEWCQASLVEEGRPAAEAVQRVLEALATVVSVTPPKSDFLLKRFAWLRDLGVEQKKAKVRLFNQVSATWPKYDQAQKSRSEAAARAIIPDYEAVLQLAMEAEDTYWATQACWYLAEIHGLIPEWYESIYWWKKAYEFSTQGHAAQELAKASLDVRARRAAETAKIKLELVDTNLSIAESKAKYQEALTNVVAAAPEGGAAPPGGAARAAAAVPKGPLPNQHTGPREWRECEARIGKLAGDPPYPLPSFLANAPWNFWFGVILKRGEHRTAQMLPGAPDLENDGGKLFLHPEGKGKTKDPIRLKLGTKPEVSEFKNVKYLDGSTGTVWHTMMQAPTTYSILGFSFRRTDDMFIVFRGASVARAKLDDAEIVVHDINGNGTFNDFGMDVIAIGKGRNMKAQPLSKYVMVEGLFYELTIEPTGRVLRLKPYDGPIAPLRLEYVGKKRPRALIATGTGEDDAYYYDLVEAMDGPIWVIPGIHAFYEGFIAEGKGDRTQMIRITRGRSGTIPIEAGKENVWKMGGAGDGFRFFFEARTEGNEVVIPAKSVGIIGGFGEGYERSTFEPVLPTVQFRKGKDGPIVATEKMRRCETADLTANNDNDLIWYPKTLTVKKSWTGDFMVRMEADYPPLGHIASDWISAR
jgi:hypothetical protein